MKTLLALPLLLATSGAALADTYIMYSTMLTADVKISVNGECKFKQTFKNAQIGSVKNETTGQIREGALSSDNQLLLFYDDSIISQRNAKATGNIVTGTTSGTQLATSVYTISDQALTQLLDMACQPDISRSNFYSNRTVQNKTSYTVKPADVGPPATATIKFNAKGRAETWVIDPAKVVNTDVINNNIRTQVIKHNGVKTTIKISYRGQTTRLD